jgi:hypothetical protein
LRSRGRAVEGEARDVGFVGASIVEGVIVDAETWGRILDVDLLMRLVKAGSREKAKTLLLEKLRATKEAIGLRSSD